MTTRFIFFLFGPQIYGLIESRSSADVFFFRLTLDLSRGGVCVVNSGVWVMVVVTKQRYCEIERAKFSINLRKNLTISPNFM